jgi:hypothetical protein
MTHRAGLAGDTAALDADRYVEPVSGARQPQRLGDNSLVQGPASEVVPARLAIDGELTVSGVQSDPGDR